MYFRVGRLLVDSGMPDSAEEVSELSQCTWLCLGTKMVRIHW